MKRLILLLSYVALVATASFGWNAKSYPGMWFYAMSPNGQWIAFSDDGSAGILHTADSVYYLYETDYLSTEYSLGQGNVGNDLGMFVGSTDEYTPAYWQDGTWTPLPLKDSMTVGNNTTANGVTADGSMIVGCISVDGWDGDTSGVSYLPVVWSRGDDGEFGEFELLPHPDKDFTGRTPQYVTAICVSDDGNTVAGQVQSYDGFTAYPIVWQKDESGQWEYNMPCLDLIVDPDAVFPEYPNYMPDYPYVSSYMTEDEIAAYNEAVTEYNDSVSEYFAGTIETYPSHYPQEKEFLTDPTDYNAAMDKYTEEYSQYSDSVEAFENVYYSAITNAGFEFNVVMLSANGKYLAQTMTAPDPDADDFDYWGGNITKPVLIDLTADGEVTQGNASDMTATYVANDGTLFCASPAVEYTRNAYVIEKGSQEPVKFDEWLAKKSEPARDWMHENMLYDVISYVENPDTWDFELVETADSLISGTLTSNPDCTCFLTYAYDQWTDGEENVGYTSWLINLSDEENPNAIRTASLKDKNSLTVRADGGQINASGMGSIALYDAQGRRVASGSGAISANVPAGIYIVKGQTDGGKPVTRKVSVGK